ncbi:protein of unknown function [Nitrospira japonica]|uniref:Uncharacterized protein n=1 Tax=Nitrospira japonica TaxID=1325564 RepID=A0A1W1I0Z2_9BACT|nr:protein of unknown function [Nitrospira japonica]
MATAVRRPAQPHHYTSAVQTFHSSGRLDKFTDILLELRARHRESPYSGSWLSTRLSGSAEANHAPFTGSVLCGARPGRSYGNGTACCADRRRRARVGGRHLSVGDEPLGYGERIGSGRHRWNSKRVSFRTAMAQVVNVH